MRQLDFTGRILTEEAEARQRNNRPPGKSLPVRVTLPSGLLAVTVVSVLYLLAQPQIRIDPQQISLSSSLTSTRTTDLSVLVRGSIARNLIAAGVHTIHLKENGFDHPVTIENGSYSRQVPLIRGRNTIQAIVGNVASKPLTIVADIPPYDIWIELSWIGKGDVDLHLYRPNGEHCFFGIKQTIAGAKLDKGFDNVTSDGPELIIMEKAIPGEYRVILNYYGPAGRDPAVPIKCTVNLRLKDGRIVRTFEKTLSQVGENQLVDTFSF